MFIIKAQLDIGISTVIKGRKSILQSTLKTEKINYKSFRFISKKCRFNVFFDVSLRVLF